MYFVACTKCKNVHQMWVHSTECKQKWPFSDNFSIKFHPETVKEHEKIKAWNNILFLTVYNVLNCTLLEFWSFTNALT